MAHFTPHNIRRTAEHMERMLKEGVLSPAAYERALNIIGIVPSGGRWRRLLADGTLYLGIILVLAGVLLLLAHYWASMGRLVRFGLIEGAILCSVFAVVWKGLDSITGKWALVIASLLIGVFFALYGDVYQSGLFAPSLFLWWGVLMSGWTFIARLPALWLLLMVLSDAVLVAGWNGAVHGGWGIALYEDLFFLNALVLVLWERFANRVQWLQSRWWPRIIGASSAVFIVIAMVQYLIYLRNDEWFTFKFDGTILPVLFACAVGTSFWCYVRRKRDLFMITMVLSAVIVVVTAFLIRATNPFDYNYPMLLMLGVAVLVQTAAAAVWLARLAKRGSEGL